MKRIMSLAALAFALCAPLGAQSLSDAYRFGAVDYTGTARSMALGGAMGALGCDLGSIGINPAGSAVAGYSQFTFTPGVSIADARSSYAVSLSDGYGDSEYRRKSTANLPNIGFSGRYDTYDSEFLRAFTFAFVMNRAYDYNGTSFASGVNGISSKFAEMANAAYGIPHDYIGTNEFYNDSRYSSYWDTAMAYEVGLINSFGEGADYVGCTEVLTDKGAHYVPGNLFQKSLRNSVGAKNDIIMNMGFDFNDRLFLGINMGLPIISYSNTEVISEVAEVPEKFPVTFNYSDGSTRSTCFNNASYQYNYMASGTGIYLKAGVIWLPFAGLRLGAAVQTPTVYEIQESWVHSGAVGYTNGEKFSGAGRTGTYEYSYSAPSQLDFSIAYTFGRTGLVSVDYTMTDYRRINFYDTWSDSDIFDFTNAAMQAFSGLSHNLRAGVEVNLTPDFALRAGVNVRTSPEMYYMVEGSQFTFDDYNDDYYYGRKELPSKSYYYNDLTGSCSVGMGYNPAGSFFADFAVRYTAYPDAVYIPYGAYAGIEPPCILIRSGLWNAALTLGWKF